MNQGAFALIARLDSVRSGNNVDLALIVEKLARLNQGVRDYVAAEERRNSHLGLNPLVARVLSFADATAISLTYESRGHDEPEEWQKNYLVALTCGATALTLDSLAGGEPSFLCRGCVTYGEHYADYDLTVGPAVEEAAAHASEPDGAFVRLLPAASTRYGEFVARLDAITAVYASSALDLDDETAGRRGETKSGSPDAERVDAVATMIKSFIPRPTPAPPVLDPYDMPLEGGGSLSCAVLNPLAFAATEDARRSAVENYSAILTSEDSTIHRQHANTMTLMEEARSLRW